MNKIGIHHNHPHSAGDRQDWARNTHTCAAPVGTPEDTTYQQFHAVLWGSLGSVRGRDILNFGYGHAWLSAALADTDVNILSVLRNFPM